MSDVSYAGLYSLELFNMFLKLKQNNPAITTTYGIEPSLADVYSGNLLQFYKKYSPNNFEGELVGDNKAHSAKKRYKATLEIPSGFITEFIQSEYNAIRSLDGSSVNSSTVVSTQLAQQLFSFNVLDMLEKQYGETIWAGAVTLVDKVAKAKTLIKKINCNWFGFGSSPTGNRANLKIWDGTTWSGTGFHILSTVAKIEYPALTPSAWIQSDGFVHILANAETSNGTIASAISTDYIEIILEL